MAKKKKPAGVDIDWYLVSIDRLKKIGIIILLVLLGARDRRSAAGTEHAGRLERLPQPPRRL